MSNDLLLACTCGTVRGIAREVDPDDVNHIVCHCDDCQTFAHALGRGDILDEHGGTTLVQMSPARLELTQGAEHLACLRLTSKGMVRWYTSCCRTPIGNTLETSWLPFVGLFRKVVDRAADGRPADEVLGPIRARVQAKSAKGDRSTLDASDSIGLLVRSARLLLRWSLRRNGWRSPLRDEAGAPRVAPRVLSPEELRDARTRAGFEPAS